MAHINPHTHNPRDRNIFHKHIKHALCRLYTTALPWRTTIPATVSSALWICMTLKLLYAKSQQPTMTTTTTTTMMSRMTQNTHASHHCCCCCVHMRLTLSAMTFQFNNILVCTAVCEFLCVCPRSMLCASSKHVCGEKEAVCRPHSGQTIQYHVKLCHIWTRTHTHDAALLCDGISICVRESALASLSSREFFLGVVKAGGGAPLRSVIINLIFCNLSNLIGIDMWVCVCTAYTIAPHNAYGGILRADNITRPETTKLRSNCVLYSRNNMHKPDSLTKNPPSPANARVYVTRSQFSSIIKTYFPLTCASMIYTIPYTHICMHVRVRFIRVVCPMDLRASISLYREYTRYTLKRDILAGVHFEKFLYQQKKYG